MIPKIIHYCWFGRNPKPKLAEKCIKSWKKKCPDYQIIEWNEDNYDISKTPLYVRQAYEAKKWAFVTDYVRLQVVYENGGIYLDTDVELKKNIDILLTNHAYFGFEEGKHINTGLGFGAEKGCKLLKELMDDYQNIPFIKDDGSYDLTPCPRRNAKVFLKHGLALSDEKQYIDDNILIFPTQYLCPIDYWTQKKNISKDTISIHWFSASWHTEEERKKHEEYQKKLKKQKRQERFDYFMHTPNRLLVKILGQGKYNSLKNKLRK